jgi:IS5 family transposase
MPQQGSFSQAEYASKKKQTRRDKFLAEMEQVVPWPRLVARLAPLYPKGERGRPPVALERMLRIHFLQQWYALADPAMEEALYDSQAMRGFAGIDLAVETVPDETTILNFRHWLERHDLAKGLFDEASAMLEEHGLLMRQSLPRRRPGGRLSMPRSSPPHPRRRTSSRAATRRCTRRRRATSGTLG